MKRYDPINDENNREKARNFYCELEIFCRDAIEIFDLLENGKNVDMTTFLKLHTALMAISDLRDRVSFIPYIKQFKPTQVSDVEF